MVETEITKKLKLRKKIFKKKEPKCIYCGCNNTLVLTLDHKVAKSFGGENTLENLNPTCFICNQLKGRLNHKDFKKYLKSLEILGALHKIKLRFKENGIFLEFHPFYYPEYYENEGLNTEDLSRDVK